VKLDGDQDLTLWLHSLEDVLRELLGDDIHTCDRHMMDISQSKVAYPKMESGILVYQNRKWHIPKWKVAFTRMESGIFQNEKWYIPEWKVAYPKMESGIYQSGKWYIPEWHIPNLYVRYTYVVPV
jgi:hypothetical protein